MDDPVRVAYQRLQQQHAKRVRALTWAPNPFLYLQAVQKGNATKPEEPTVDPTGLLTPVEQVGP